MASEDDDRGRAMVEFLRTFPTISTPPDALADLHDGVALFEALSEIAPDYFDPTTIGRHLGDNWALKSSNIRKLLRNLEHYYHEELKKDADFSISLAAIARNQDPEAIQDVVELVAAAAVTCSNKSEYVSRIMSMSPEAQVEMKGILESSLGRLSAFTDDDEEEGDENELVFGGGAEEDDEDDTEKDEVERRLFGANHLLRNQDDEDLQQQLEDVKRELAAVKSQSSIQQEDHENALKKLRALADDLQDRLVQRQDELIQVEEDLQNVTTELEETKAKLSEAMEEKAQIADDLDVANAKAQQLHRVEATLMTYKKKLENAGLMTQQMTELEEQAAKYVRQIVDLEAEVKRSNALQKHVNELQEQIARLEREKTDTANSSKSSAEEIAELKSKLSAVESAKKMFEKELNELRAQQESKYEEVVSPMHGIQLSNGTPSKEDREKMMRLQAENDMLREELSKVQQNVDGLAKVVTAAPVSADDSAEMKAMKDEIARLKEEIVMKTKENAKIAGDKDKLEAYTKRTLAKFQDKYLVALQECKAKLKEKQDKIEALENRSANERTAQKREERLLSSTIYELGMAIMQNRLKER